MYSIQVIDSSIVCVVIILKSSDAFMLGIPSS